MSKMSRSSSTIDPSSFLRTLQSTISQLRPTFHYNVQQDVAEVLDLVLTELAGPSNFAQDLSSLTITYTKTCNECFFSYNTEEFQTMLVLPVSNSVQSSLDNYLKEEQLCGSNQWFCPICEKLCDASLETRISSCSKFLIVQLRRFSHNQGVFQKNNAIVQCLPSTDSKTTDFLRLPAIVEDDVSLFNGYSLMATINHSGTLNNGHYWAYIKKANSWLLCNDTLVCDVKPSALNNKSVYVLFYERK